MAVAAIMYHKGGNFDMDYYISKHMPLVEEIWKPYGLTGYKIVEFHNEGNEGPYRVMAVLDWKDHDSWKKAALADESKAIFKDLNVFADRQPDVLGGPVVGISG